MTLAGIGDYLKGDLTASIRNDIGPMIRPDRPEGGYFGVCRMVLCYVDYLGALYQGYQGKKDKKSGRLIIAESSKAKSFLKEVFCEIDPSYRERAELLYETYRHGTVHLYQPKVLEDNGRRLEWLVYKGDRESWVYVGSRAIKVRHLQPLEFEPSTWLFPISIVCLYSDLIKAIDVYQRKLGEDPALVDRFVTTWNVLVDPELTKLNWWE